MFVLEPFPERRPLDLLCFNERLRECLNFREQFRTPAFKGQANSLCQPVTFKIELL